MIANMSYHRIVLLFLVIANFNDVLCENYTPIVMWHGMGDSCCNPLSLGSAKRQLQKALPGVHVVSLKIGDNLFEDMLSGFFLHPNQQVEQACNIVKSDPRLVNGYNAIGFSQGAQFLRALAQRCPEPKMKNLASLGGQHQGVYGVPRCSFCDDLRPTLTKILYSSSVQEHLVQATYWHDPLNKTSYQDANTFLADINNEYVMNNSYVENLQTLENVIFIKFEDDEMVKPRESQWFGFYKDGQTEEIEPLQKSEVYVRLGLKQMEEDGKLHFLSTPGDHLQFSWSWFIENVINKFFK